MRRRWAINGRFLTQPMTGVTRVAREIVSALDELMTSAQGGNGELASDIDIEILCPPGAAPMAGLETIRTRTVGRRTGHLWEQIELPRHVEGGLLSLCNTGPLAIDRQIVCMHDANTFAFPASFSWQHCALHRILMPGLGRRAVRIATVSQHAAGELTKFGVCAADKIVVIPNGHEHALAWRPQRDTATGKRDTILALGNPSQHKNIPVLLDLLPALKRAGLKLAVAGKLDQHVFSNRGAVALMDADNLILLGAVSDDELAALYGDCLCLAFPSFAEGFGLPPLEAMALGCPVVVSDCASLPEICGNAALYASPTKPDEWLASFKRLAADPALRQSLAARGRVRAHQFSWRKAARLYLDAMASVDGVERPVSRAPVLQTRTG